MDYALSWKREFPMSQDILKHASAREFETATNYFFAGDTATGKNTALTLKYKVSWVAKKDMHLKALIYWCYQPAVVVTSIVEQGSVMESQFQVSKIDARRCTDRSEPLLRVKLWSMKSPNVPKPEKFILRVVQLGRPEDVDLVQNLPILSFPRLVTDKNLAKYETAEEAIHEISAYHASLSKSPMVAHKMELLKETRRSPAPENKNKFIKLIPEEGDAHARWVHKENLFSLSPVFSMFNDRQGLDEYHVPESKEALSIILYYVYIMYFDPLTIKHMRERAGLCAEVLRLSDFFDIKQCSQFCAAIMGAFDTSAPTFKQVFDVAVSASWYELTRVQFRAVLIAAILYRRDNLGVSFRQDRENLHGREREIYDHIHKLCHKNFFTGLFISEREVDAYDCKYGAIYKTH